MVKRFVIGFAVGLGLMYYYLEHGDQWMSDSRKWMQKSASSYRHDKMQEAAQDALGNKGR